MKLVLPELAPVETTLLADEYVTKGGADSGAPASELGSRVLLGGPICLPVEAAISEGGELERLAAAQSARYKYHLIHLSCTFQPAQAETFEKAWVQVALQGSDPAGGDPPIAWSMTPQRVANPVVFSIGLELKADLKFIPLTLTGSDKRELTRDEIFLEALNELRADPTWEFARTAASEIRGSQRLVLVTRSSRDASSSGAVAVRVSIRRSRLKAFPYRVLLGSNQAAQFPIT